jgi:hypothetical protein
MSSATTFWGNYGQKMYSDEVKWCSPNTMIVHFNRVDVHFLSKINLEMENRYYIHKVNNHYQYIGKVLAWNVIQVEKGYANLELVINQCPKQQPILFHTKNDVCSYFGITPIKTEDLMKKIQSHP